MKHGVLWQLTLLVLAAAGPGPDQPAGKVETILPEHVVTVLGRPVAESGGKTIGRLVDVMVDQNGTPRAAIIDFGGFFGVGIRKVAIQWQALRFQPGDQDHPIVVELTPDQIKAAPEYKDVSRPAPILTPDTSSPNVGEAGASGSEPTISETK